MCNSSKRIFILSKRNILEIIRDPLSLIFTILIPLFMEILFYFLFHNLTSQFEMRYLAPGIAVFSQSFLTLFTGILISTDRKTSFLTRLYVTKTKSYEFIFSYTIGILPITIIQSILFFMIGSVIDTSIFTLNMIPAIFLSLVTSLFFIAVGILFGSVCNEKSIGGISSIMIVGQSVLSGMWFPIEGLDSSMVTIMKVLPFKNATTLIQNMIIGFNDVFKDIFLPLIIVLGYTIIAFAIAIIVFKSKMKEK